MAQRKVIVEVCAAHNLMPKDGEGSASPYVQVDFDGQRKRTRTKPKDLNPVWDEVFEFWVSNPAEMSEECLEAIIYNEKKSGRRSHFLGRVCIPGYCIVRRGEEAVEFHPLEKRGLFSHIKGELGLKVYYEDEQYAPPPMAAEAGMPPASDPPAPPPAEPPQEAPPPPPATDQSPPPPSEPELPPPAAPLPSSPPPQFHPSSSPTPVRRLRDGDPYPLRDTYPPLGGDKVITYDLVEKMYYLFVSVVKARDLAAKDFTGSSDPYVRVSVGSHTARTRTVPHNLYPEWHEVFAFGNWDHSLRASTLEVSVWDEDIGKPDDFLGEVPFDVQEIPKRAPPDSPLAPQWYRLDEVRGFGRVKGDVMLAVWMGTQADEAFPEAWQSDTGGRQAHTRAKVYMSPKLWYLRVSVIEAQDVQSTEKIVRYPEVAIVRVELGFQRRQTRATSRSIRTTSPIWDEDLLLVAAEPFEEHLAVSVLDRRGPNHDEPLGNMRIPLHSVERRLDNRPVVSRWFNLNRPDGDPTLFRGRLHLRLCFEGGYHVMDETAYLSSDFRPTARQLWRPALGVLEVGILGAQNLQPMKSKEGRGATDAYAVAKYGSKWVRTRTIVDSFSPRWNEQYTWDVHDPCTVLTVGIFDNYHVSNDPVSEGSPMKIPGLKDTSIGKVRIRLSTLETQRVYTHSYPLLRLHPSGARKMGELELAVRFSSASMLTLLHAYSQPLFPRMHYLQPLSLHIQEDLRRTAMDMVALRLTRSEPPLRSEVVRYMLDTASTRWSMRRCRANWHRISSVLGGVFAVSRWLEDICRWRNPTTTILVHILFIILVCYPELILPTLFLYMFLIGAWHYRFRPRSPAHMDARLSQAEFVYADEMDEEFDTFPMSSRPHEVLRPRYDRLRNHGSQLQNILGDVASQGERIQALLSWRDPRATTIFITACLIAALILYVSPIRLVLLCFGLYYLRHPRFRELKPPAVLNFFKRLPTFSDRVL